MINSYEISTSDRTPEYGPYPSPSLVLTDKMKSLNDAIRRQQLPLLEAVQTLVRIPSVIEEPVAGCPFGRPIDEALHSVLSIAEGLGFRTVYEAGGYYGYAEIDSGEQMIGVLGHVDVVPPGSLESWQSAPFTPELRSERLYGRGTQDNKGPLLAALFAAKALLDCDQPLNKRVRFIFGTDEESLWRGIRRYREHEELPTIGFSPDASFPLVYAEKGLLQCYLETDKPAPLQLSAGEALNAVPDLAVYSGNLHAGLSAQLDLLGYPYRAEDGQIAVQGKAAHAMEPEKGANAICRLAIALDKIGVHSAAIRFLAEMIGEDPYASEIFGSCQDEPSGQLRLNAGQIYLGDTQRLGLDIRIPVTEEKARIVEQLVEAGSRYGLSYRQYDWEGPLYFPAEHLLVRKLLAVYREQTGDHSSPPISSGGATYARAVPNCLAFGANFPGHPDVEHRPNEYIALADMYKALGIYAYTLLALLD